MGRLCRASFRILRGLFRADGFTTCPTLERHILISSRLYPYSVDLRWHRIVHYVTGSVVVKPSFRKHGVPGAGERRSRVWTVHTKLYTQSGTHKVRGTVTLRAWSILRLSHELVRDRTLEKGVFGVMVCPR